MVLCYSTIRWDPKSRQKLVVADSDELQGCHLLVFSRNDTLLCDGVYYGQKSIGYSQNAVAPPPNCQPDLIASTLDERQGPNHDVRAQVVEAEVAGVGDARHVEPIGISREDDKPKTGTESSRQPLRTLPLILGRHK